MLAECWSGKMILFEKFKDFLRTYRNGIAINYYNKKIRANKQMAELIEQFDELELHYADYKLSEKNVVIHIGIQLAELIFSTQERMENANKGERFLDAGDSDGIVLKSLGIENGVSVNLSKDCTVLIKQNGGIVVRGDIENLPFKNSCFENTICFETIEHLENPIKGLKELARVSENVFLSIPRLNRTRVSDRDFSHTFEFSEEDFKKILTYTDFKVKYYSEIKIFPRILNPLHYLILRFFYFRSFFPKLQFYELSKDETKDA